MRRIELLTPCLQGRCSPSWATPPNLSWYFVRNNLPYTRTALRCSFLVWATNCRSFVSFALIFRRLCVSRDRRVHMVRKGYENIQDTKNLVGLSGLEPPTSRLSGVRSNRLSYRPMQGILWVLISFNSHIFIFLTSMFISEHWKINSTGSWSTNRNVDRQILLLVGSP